MGNFQPFHDRQSLWAEFYKTGLELWQLPEDSDSRPTVYDSEGDQVYHINEYAYWFAESCLADYDMKWSRDNKVLDALKTNSMVLTHDGDIMPFPRTNED